MITRAHSLPSNVKRKPQFIEALPWIGKGKSTALYPNIWMCASEYDDLLSPSPNPYNIALLVHEQEHIKRMKQAGPIKWIAKYIVNNSFRFNEELAALRPQFAVLKKHGLDPYLQYRAKRLSGWLYFWPVSIDEALIRLKELWNETIEGEPS